MHFKVFIWNPLPKEMKNDLKRKNQYSHGTVKGLLCVGVNFS